MALVTYQRTTNRLMGAEERARLEGMTEAEVMAAAGSDPDAQPMGDADIVRLQAARLAKAARRKAGLSQAKFAQAYGIKVARLRDMEQGRVKPDRVLVSLIALISDDPERARRVMGELT